jgi:hypothetical protein
MLFIAYFHESPELHAFMLHTAVIDFDGLKRRVIRETPEWLIKSGQGPVQGRR